MNITDEDKGLYLAVADRIDELATERLVLDELQLAHLVLAHLVDEAPPELTPLQKARYEGIRRELETLHKWFDYFINNMTSDVA